jgi:hypothetical protein
VTCCAIVELRQYTLKPGQRDILIALFERAFVESQEACGITLIGQFRDLDDPDRFVWLRGFASMAARVDGLAAFYGGPVWKAHREAANATMIDSGNVLLLRPVGSGFALPPSRGAPDIPGGVLTATIYNLAGPADDAFIAALACEKPPLASFVTEPSANTFPALPVREGENVFVRFSKEPQGAMPMPATSRFVGAPAVLRLQPTARSRLRG